MKRIYLFLALATTVAISTRAAVEIPPTTANYDVLYHLGFINKVAGSGTVNFRTEGNEFFGSLNGHSIPWDGKIYTVQSSLSAIFTPSPSGPSHETITGMQGTYTKPEVGQTSGYAYKNIYGGGTLSASQETMEAVEVMTQMISMFYYARDIDFAALQPGQNLQIPISRSGLTDWLYINYIGQSEFSYGGYSTPAYEVVFRYTYNGAPDRYPVTCLIGCDNRLPLKFSADLLIGHIQMCYVN